MTLPGWVTRGINGARSAPEVQHPAEWADAKGLELWSAQRDILSALVDDKRVVVRSCHASGKSMTAAIAMAWWIDVDPENSFVVSTAPSGPQVKAILWRYLNQLHDRLHLPGRCNLQEWYIGREIVGYGRKPSDYNPEAFQGIHAPRVLIVLDEGSGIPFDLWTAAETLMTGERCRLLAIGNPDSAHSEFANACAPNSGYRVFRIPAFSTPAFTGEAVSEELRSGLITRSWVEDKVRRWGIDSPLYQSKVDAEFPVDSAERVVIPLGWLNRQATDPYPEVDPLVEQVVTLGVDVGAGGDLSVITEMVGSVMGRVWTSNTRESMELVGEVAAVIRETGAVTVAIDSIGWGWAVAGRLQEMGAEGIHGATIIPVNVAESSSEPKRFINLRSQLWWLMREQMEDKAIWLPRPTDGTEGYEDLCEELTAPKWSYNSKNQIVVEAKDVTKKTIGRSPDRADSLLLAEYAKYAPAIYGSFTSADYLLNASLGR